VIRPHPYFRLFATANTVGLGDTTGLYHGTQQINQGQMDRWSHRHHAQLSAARRRGRHRAAKQPRLRQSRGPEDHLAHGAVADLTRSAFMNGDSRP
jgi:cobaltochelatase CobS